MQNNTFSGYSERQRLIVVDKLPSTNDYLKRYASNFTPRDEFTAIMAINQTAGRGQRDTSFLSVVGESLTFSFIIFPKTLTPADLFLINIAVSLGIQDWLLTRTATCFIKWPNDIIINHKKAGGILIENTISGQGIKHSIVGIGLNVLQTSFPDDLAHKATSLALNIPDIDRLSLESMCREIVQYIRLRYQKIHLPDEREKLLADYNQCLYRRDIAGRYIIHDREVEGVISHVDRNGLIHLAHDGGVQRYSLKNVVMVF